MRFIHIFHQSPIDPSSYTISHIYLILYAIQSTYILGSDFKKDIIIVHSTVTHSIPDMLIKG